MNQLEARLEDVKTPLNVAVIGCVVNGPGEAKEADLGFTGGNPESLALFIDGKPAARLPGSDFLDELESMIRKQAEIKEHARAELIAHSTDTH
jgi:(E)-4-hydroxy-3-methylbut-2-enyl-diphosphate synthase